MCLGCRHPCNNPTHTANHATHVPHCEASRTTSTLPLQPVLGHNDTTDVHTETNLFTTGRDFSFQVRHNAGPTRNLHIFASSDCTTGAAATKSRVLVHAATAGIALAAEARVATDVVDDVLPTGNDGE